VNDDFEHYIDKYYAFWQRLIPTDAFDAVLKPIWGKVGHLSTRDVFRDVFPTQAEARSPEDYINHSLYLEAKTFLHSVLVVEDKLSMAHSLETRVPFLDNDLVTFAQSVPVGLKLGNLDRVVKLDENEIGAKTREFFHGASDGKLLLRQAMRRYLPLEVTTREKQGFSGPDASWFRGESIEYVRRLLLQGEPRIYEYLDRAAVEVLVDDHLHGRENRRLLIWSLVCLEHWCRIFLDGEPVEAA
jgi:asparagine synthase (glutamine-hydrolysing)